MNPIHPTIAAFEAGAELLDVQGSKVGIDDLLVRLASWMDLASTRLTEDDQSVLIGIGAALYREGLRQRVPKNDGY